LPEYASNVKIEEGEFGEVYDDIPGRVVISVTRERLNVHCGLLPPA
jgi:hypothetical protein